MTIPLETPNLFEEFGFYENCVFCSKATKYWHYHTNSPVCPECAKGHKVAELTDHMKKIKK